MAWHSRLRILHGDLDAIRRQSAPNWERCSSHPRGALGCHLRCHKRVMINLATPGSSEGCKHSAQLAQCAAGPHGASKAQSAETKWQQGHVLYQAVTLNAHQPLRHLHILASCCCRMSWFASSSSSHCWRTTELLHEGALHHHCGVFQSPPVGRKLGPHHIDAVRG